LSDKKTALITGASHGIGAGLADAFLKEGYNVVATALDASKSLTASPSLVLVDGDISKQETSAKTVDAAIQHFGTIDVLVNNAGIYRTKVFTDFTTDDFNALVSTNLLGFLYMTQLTVKQMLKQKSGNVVTISAALADQPIAGINASVSMITKGGPNTVTRSLAIEYAKEGIRFNAVAPGVVYTPLHKNDPPGLSYFEAANGKNRRGKRCCGRRALPGTGRSGNWRGAPRGWWRSRWLLVRGLARRGRIKTTPSKIQLFSTINAAIDNVGIPSWCFTLPESETNLAPQLTARPVQSRPRPVGACRSVSKYWAET